LDSNYFSTSKKNNNDVGDTEDGGGDTKINRNREDRNNQAILSICLL